MCAAGVASASPVVLPNGPGIVWQMCNEPGNSVTFRQPEGTDQLIIACTKTDAHMTIQGCIGPHVKRDRATDMHTITCDRMRIYQQVPVD